MDTKLKGWKVIKIICFVMILLLCVGILSRALMMVITYDETRVSPEIVLADLSGEPVFMAQHMREALSHAFTVAYFVSEEAIMSGAHVQWRNLGTESRWEEGGFVYREVWDGNSWGFEETFIPDRLETVNILELRSSSYGFYWYGQVEIPVLAISEPLEQAEIPINAIDPQYVQLMQRMERDAIAQQSREFRNARRVLENLDGLLFYINSEVSEKNSPDRMAITFVLIEGNGEVSIELQEATQSVELQATQTVESQTFRNITSNVGESEQSEQFFREHSAFYIVSPDNDQPLRPAYLGAIHFNHFSSSSGEPATIRLAFTQESVNARSIIYNTARSAYILDLSNIAVMAVLILGMVVVLLIGAGREYKLVDGVKTRSEIRFRAFDKPYLDIGLATVICWSVFIIYVSYQILTSSVMRIHNIVAFHILFALTVLLIVPPLLIWLMSFAKRIKDGQFWKHTFVYAILVGVLYRFARYCLRTVRSLWAGTRLTGKVAIISASAFFALLFTGIVGNVNSGVAYAFLVALIFMGAVAYLLLHYAKRIRNLELGAKSISEGNYDTSIDVGGGELGNIADSINNISAGINEAVEERMKSERLKTELITNVSHDIRTPLTSIITYTDLLESEGLDCEKAPEYLDVLKKKSLRLKTLTDELFEAAKAVSGNIDVNLTNLNVGSLVKQVLGELESAVQESGLDIRSNLPEKLYAKADGRLMQRVLENLLSNVFKYSMPNSRVYLDLYPIDSNYVRIEIKNVSAKELNFDPSELIERFKRGDDSRADGGSGLGLSIVQSFATAQGGRFDIAIDGDLFKTMVTLPMA